MVAQYWAPVSASPASVLQILDIRDGGWNLWAGLLVAALWAAWSCRGHALLKRGVLQSLGGASSLMAAYALRKWVEPPESSLPSLTLVSAAAQPTDLRSYGGQPLVINLWASWCPPCKREMPVLAQAQKDHPACVSSGSTRVKTPLQCCAICSPCLCPLPRCSWTRTARRSALAAARLAIHLFL
jgi:hypothetical protein